MALKKKDIIHSQAVGNDYEQEKMTVWQSWSTQGYNLEMERLYIKQAGRLSGSTRSTASCCVVCESTIVYLLTTIPPYCPCWAALCTAFWATAWSWTNTNIKKVTGVQQRIKKLESKGAWLGSRSKEKLLQRCWRECRSAATNNKENTEHTSMRPIFF